MSDEAKPVPLFSGDVAQKKVEFLMLQRRHSEAVVATLRADAAYRAALEKKNEQERAQAISKILEQATASNWMMGKIFAEMLELVKRCPYALPDEEPAAEEQPE